MATKKTIENPDSLEYTAEELELIQKVRENQKNIAAAQGDNKVKIPALASFIERNRAKLEAGATLGTSYIRIKYAEKFLVEEA